MAPAGWNSWRTIARCAYLPSIDYLRLTGLKVVYTEEALYAVLVTTVKTSVLLFYLRIFGVIPAVRKTIYATEALVVAWCIAAFFVSIFQCLPVSDYFENNTNPYCVKFLLATAIPNTVLDIVLLVLPLCVVRTLQLSTRKKIGLIVIFSLGFLYVFNGHNLAWAYMDF